jgi:hypothetical protein
MLVNLLKSNPLGHADIAEERFIAMAMGAEGYPAGAIATMLGKKLEDIEQHLVTGPIATSMWLAEESQ